MKRFEYKELCRVIESLKHAEVDLDFLAMESNQIKSVQLLVSDCIESLEEIRKSEKA